MKSAQRRGAEAMTQSANQPEIQKESEELHPEFVGQKIVEMKHRLAVLAMKLNRYVQANGSSPALKAKCKDCLPD